MNGEDLFNLFRQAMADEGVDMDEWEHAEPSERAAWDALAERVEVRS